MGAITEDTLRGEWFYLEEEEPFDPLRSKVYELAGGEVRSGGEIVGTYAVGGDAVTLDMNPTGDERRWTITLQAAAEQEPDATTPWLQADSTLEFPDQEPWSTYGSFRRKSVDYVEPGEIRRLSP